MSQVIVPDDKLSLAIGKAGQNVRLAAKLTGWKIDVKPESFLKPANTEVDNTETEYELTELSDDSSFVMGDLEELEPIDNEFDSLDDSENK